LSKKGIKLVQPKIPTKSPQTTPQTPQNPTAKNPTKSPRNNLSKSKPDFMRNWLALPQNAHQQPEFIKETFLSLLKEKIISYTIINNEHH